MSAQDELIERSPPPKLDNLEVDENKDGIPDAIITITPLSNIGLTANTTSFTISGLTGLPLAWGPRPAT